MGVNSSKAPQTSAAARERILKALEQGAPWNACDAFREALATSSPDAELLYWGALAHARSGAIHEAHVLLDRAESADPPTDRLREIRSLRGRLWKDSYHGAPEAPEAATLLRRARDEYLAAYALDHDTFPGINAATLSRVLGDRAESQRLAHEVSGRLAQTAPRNFWDLATVAEAHLLLGNIDLAREGYASAYREARGDAGSVATMRRQVNLLARVLPEARTISQILPAPDVVAFAGHMLDSPGRAVPRFPSELVPAVERALRERLAGLHHPIVYSSAACGADLLFIETAVAQGAEVNVVLPFDRADFVRTSVVTGGEEWVRRFDMALERSSRVIMATEENHLGDDVLFDHASMLLEGFACLRAAQLETAPSLLCVLDAASDGRVGGTHATVERWRRNIGEPQVIDLSSLRRGTRASDRATSDDPSVSSSAHAPLRASEPIVAPAGTTRPQRTLKTLLFADFAGFTSVHDALAPLFQERFFRIAAQEIDASRAKPRMASTWGDALYVVFDRPEEGADFALRFLASMRAADWTALGLPDSSQIRIALHTGPVFCGLDPIANRDNYYGSSVNKAARIEPVTPPGMVYASEAFAASLAATGQAAYSLEYVGRLALAKGYGESRIYRLERRSSVGSTKSDVMTTLPMEGSSGS